MQRIRSSLAIGACLMLASAALALPALAQGEPSPDHPIVGAWVSLGQEDGSPPEVVTFGADGIVVDSSPDGVALGSWVATGERTADLTIKLPISDPTGGFAGLGTARGSVEVSADGQSFTGSYTLEPPPGSGAPEGEYGPAEVTAQRIAVEPMGTPVGPIPEGPGPSPAGPAASPATPEGSSVAEGSPEG